MMPDGLGAILFRYQYLRTWRLRHHRLIVIDRPPCILPFVTPCAFGRDFL